MILREITIDEKRLLDYLMDKAKIKLSHDWEKHLKVASLDDEGMGSLYLCSPSNKEYSKRKFGKMVSECIFKDTDGVDVIASLYLDEDKQIYEIDIFKVDFSKFQSIPKTFD